MQSVFALQAGAKPGRLDEGGRAAGALVGPERTSPIAATTAAIADAESGVQIGGPWAHLTVSANETKFHLAEASRGPLVLLLHGFPEFGGHSATRSFPCPTPGSAPSR
jgi:hypothetical protein